MLAGVAGCGKDTWLQDRKDTLLDTNYDFHSSDDIRMELFGELAQDKNGVVFDTMKKRSLESLRAGRNVIYNATNLNRKRRASLYRDIKKEGHKVGIVVFMRPLAWLLRSNENREESKQVPSEVVKNMYLTFQIPRVGVDCDSILVEGNQYFSATVFENIYDSLDSILADTKDKDILEEISLNYTSHDTPYHLEAINEHIDMCIENSQSPNMKMISLFHDLGKGVAKDGGRYIGHENVSAMYMLNALWFSNENSFDMAEVIYQHMNAHRGISDAVIDRNRLTDEIVALATYFAHNIDEVSRIVEQKT